MIKVELESIAVTPYSYLDVIEWCVNTYGHAGDRWRVLDLKFLIFNKQSDVTLFLLRWPLK